MLNTPKAITSHCRHQVIVVVFAVVVVMLMVTSFALGQNFTILHSFKVCPMTDSGPFLA